MQKFRFDKDKELVITKGRIAKNIFRYEKIGDSIKIDYLQRNGIIKQYKYKFNNVTFLSDPKEIDITSFSFVLNWNKKPLNNLKRVLLFENSIYKAYTFKFKNDTYASYLDKDMSISTNIANESTVNSLKNYYIDIDEEIGIKTPEGDHILKKRLQALNFISNDSVLNFYVKGESKKTSIAYNYKYIFPFGSNLSQMKAVFNALNYKISVIEGPPGTGKTQTILNIIANIVSNGMNCAVISNNNSATNNVYEKLQKYGYGFICATLGSMENKKEFIEHKQIKIDRDFLLDNEEVAFNIDITKLNKEISKLYEIQNDIANKKIKLKELEVEFRHFLESIDRDRLKNIDCDFTDKAIMELIKRTRKKQESRKKYGFIFKLKIRLFYGKIIRNIFNLTDSIILDNLYNLYYLSYIERLKNEIDIHLKLLVNFDEMKDQLEQLSNYKLKKDLNEKYEEIENTVFEESIFFKDPNEFIRRYPVILSTTYSITSSLKNIEYDYIIVDEASQVDLSTSFLSMSVAKNIVVVGDLMQLPNVITNKDKLIVKDLSAKHNVEFSKRFEENSLLSSIVKSIPSVPRILLKEHYRCHPKIINFCNKKFYDNQLVIMTTDHDEPSVLRVIKTVPGNHARELLNCREADVVLGEAIPLLEANNKNNDIGIICPYNEQKDYINKKLEKKSFAICDTVHKFQGREKNDIIITTVDNELTSFTDNANMINVSVSRAKNHLILVTNHNIESKQSNVRDLVEYIKYNNFEVVDSKINSVFDLLYGRFNIDRRNYLNNSKKISEFDSENLIYKIIKDILVSPLYNTLNVLPHYPLSKLLIDNQTLSSEERAYAFHPNTHLDFVVYNKLSKRTILAIEVDGYKYHKKGTVQSKRDKNKDLILEKYGIPLIRLNTTESNEKERIRIKLNNILSI